MWARPSSMVHAKLFVDIARFIGASPSSCSKPLSSSQASDRPRFLFLADGGLNGLARALPVGRRQFRKAGEGRGRRQMMAAVDADRVAGDVAAAVRHQEDQEIAQLIHLAETAQRNLVCLRCTDTGFGQWIELVPRA